MSLNDLWNSEYLLPLVGMVFIFFVAIWFAATLDAKTDAKNKSKETEAQIYGDDETGEIKEDNAKILVRRSNPNPLNQSVRVNTVVFETTAGNRIELAIKDLNTYNLMIEGDEGILCYQGKRFIEFRREALANAIK